MKPVTSTLKEVKAFQKRERAKRRVAKALAPAPKPTIYIAVRGGVVQGVRYEQAGKPADAEVVLVDYDDYAWGGAESAQFATEEEFERDRIGGRTWDDLEKTSKGVF